MHQHNSFRPVHVFGVSLVALLSVAACGSDSVPSTSGGQGGAVGGGGSDVGGQSVGGGGGNAEPCPEGLELCGDLCVAVMTDEQHCGACNESCAEGEFCIDGSCTVSCPPGQTLCDGACTDTSVDGSNCGDCGKVCSAGDVCDGIGQCALSCQDGLVACDGVCTDPNTDREHCGAGSDCAAEPGVACAAGEICDGTGQCQLSCQDGLVECNGKCIDPEVDPLYCGASGSCQAAEAGDMCGFNQACVAGQCSDLSPVKLVFVSSVTHDADFGGLEGADDFCQGLADAAGLGGTYMAWLSDDTGSPSTRFTQWSGQYVLVDGTVIADDWADLTDGTLDHAIDVTETGGTPMDGSLGVCGNTKTAWSNTDAAGDQSASIYSCTNWTGVSVNGARWGRWEVTDSSWTLWCSGGSCQFQASVYCFQQ